MLEILIIWKFPKYHWKLLNTFWFMMNYVYFAYLLSWDSHVGCVELVPGISCFAEKTNISLLFCSFFLFFRVLNNFYTFTKVAGSLKMYYFFENIYMVTLWWLTTLRYVGRICAVLGWYFKGYVSCIYYYVDLCTTLTNASQHNIT